MTVAEVFDAYLAAPPNLRPTRDQARRMGPSVTPGVRSITDNSEEEFGAITADIPAPRAAGKIESGFLSALG
jgi:hypothetical protein